MSVYSSFMLCFLFIVGSPLVSEETFHLVAFDDAGDISRQPHLLSGGVYDFPDIIKGIDSTVAYGDEVVFGYDQMRKEATYRLKITCLSDQPRVQRLCAGSFILMEKRVLEKGSPTTNFFDIPKEAYTAGNLLVRIERCEGPNAVVSSIEILSSHPDPLPPFPEPPVPKFTLPRLSPRPESIVDIATPIVDLQGTWSFCPDPGPDFFTAAQPEACWEKIEVPGQWLQQGYRVDEAKAGGYFKTFELPCDWAGRRIKLRCDGVYSDAVVYVNGMETGHHMGGFSPFELDPTDQVKPGVNSIALKVIAGSLADTLASGIQYAFHDLGGIPRKLYLFTLPVVNIARLHVETKFDAQYENAELKLCLQVANEGPDGPVQAAAMDRPLLFGEYCHLNTYNRHELATDPGVRDAWGRGFARMWEEMVKIDGILGGALWSGVDELFILPSGLTAGYGS
ncbi:MAG: sugar-binding domain-containing protein [Planctomycetota bacterium]